MRRRRPRAAVMLFAGLCVAGVLAGFALPVRLGGSGAVRPAGAQDRIAGGVAAEAALADAAVVERGAYLARAGNCMACHTARGGAPYAGGRPITTPFGDVHSSNLTPDEKTGIGRWSSDDFWLAMHEGRSKDGRLLYPAFPYPYFTLVTREDSDAIFAYLRTLAPVQQENRPHDLRFPVDTQAALAVWRALFFEPGSFEAQPAQSARWNRGAYLVRGLGHCAACHSPRNLLGAASARDEFTGGPLPAGDWYAPSLGSPAEAGVAQWSVDDVVELLAKGRTEHASTLGPMAEVVYRSTQFLSADDLAAMAVYLQSLPQTITVAPPSEPAVPDGQQLAQGREIYQDRCAQCHGDEGQGAPGAYSPLAGNRAALMDPPANAIRVVLDGGFAPSTRGNPRPYGMPPFAHVLDNAGVADVLTYVRNAWGNRASPVSSLEVLRHR